MPLFEYAPCNDASESSCCRFETLQSSTEPALIRCPTCGAPVQKVISTFGIGTAASGPSVQLPSAASKSSSPASRIVEAATHHTCHAGCCH